MTSKELVYKTLSWQNTNRAPRQMWDLPWAGMVYGKELASIKKDYPDDIITVCAPTKEVSKVRQGDPYIVGRYIDEWGCIFQNVHKGIIGEVKEPIVKDEDWEDVANVHIPIEQLTFEIDIVNKIIARDYKDKFVLGGCLPRPFEQLQFIRGTENLFIDLCFKPKKLMEFIKNMHGFYCKLVEKWCQTDIDAIFMMDDWGSQQSLLISPTMWVDIFKPLYRDYIAIAKRYNKKAFMHSDGYTMEIIPHLIEIGLDAFNTQIFCMGVEKLKQFSGKITFWGEIDRQNLLPNGSVQDIFTAVKLVHDTLYLQGGCIAQCEFGAGAKPENVRAVYKSWDMITNK